ncbi:hypothetical protein K491DRAFT_707972 [Lophiostoma macrostomum CBS 122681]|uniref:Arylformamidase n=1 Tax=Lophiostoma macrostomum CBS 122681 TaxID=1314788 RepID=A0A6A6ST24_9PLEO|nr:hypothetical protein K491DRAFT_707972 [Lophiostoma macrostomum CBS 122681]
MAAMETNWKLIHTSSPHLPAPVQVIAAKHIPYTVNGNRLQTLNVYLAHNRLKQTLLDKSVTSLPIASASATPRWLVHIHGGAWRDPNLTAESIEATVAHAFNDETSPIVGIASINYTVSPFPIVPDWLPTKAYDPVRDNHADTAREGRHPQHIFDVLSGFAFLRSLGLTDGSYILTGHSAESLPRPAAVAGLNGLYDLPALVTELGRSHAHLSVDYVRILTQAFGEDREVWKAASPALFDKETVARKVSGQGAPILVVIDQSVDDELVPFDQRDRLADNLRTVDGLKVVLGNRLSGKHISPWTEGLMIWETVQDILAHLAKDSLV